MFAPLPPDTILDRRYRVIDLLGRGGMGTVYRAQHLGLDREVALKVIQARGLGDDLATRLEVEARAAARLDHPGCVRVLDYGRTAGFHFLAMERIDGPTLGAVLAERGPLPAVEVIAIARQVLEALDHAHGQDVLHRDIKPSNLMVRRRDGRSEIVLIDFGLARLQDEAPVTLRGICPCSPIYVAPERLRGHAYDGRADLYSLGVVLYELLTGRRPFDSTSPERTAKLGMTMPPPPFDPAHGVPPMLAHVVMQMLAKEPAERPPNARELDLTFARIAALLASDTASLATEDATDSRIALVDPSQHAVRRAWRWLKQAMASDPAASLGTVELSSADLIS